MDEKRREERTSEIPEQLRRIKISGPSDQVAEGQVIDISSLGARVEVPGPSSDCSWKKGDQLSVRSGQADLQLSALVVYVRPGADGTLLGLFFNRPNEQNQLARLLSPR